MISVILFKTGKHCDFYLSFFQMVGAWRDFTVVIKLIKNFKSLYGFGGRCLKIKDVCMDFQPYFKVHHLVSVHPKSIILGLMTNLNMIFHVLVSVYWFLKIWNSPKSIAEFRNSQWHWIKRAAKRSHMHNTTTIVYLVHSFDIFLFQGSGRHSNKEIYRRDQNRWPLRV